MSGLRELGPSLEPDGGWIDGQLSLLARQDALRWVIPTEFGGTAIPPAELIERYIDLSEACLTTAFVLTQRNGACQRLAAAIDCPARSRLLPRLATGELFATVGISHLTTSRRHIRQPAVAVEATQNGYRLNGEIPWVTGAAHADELVTGGTLPDGAQVLLIVDATSAGISVAPPLPLLALTASHTAAVTMRDVDVPRERLLFGPAPEVMKLGPGGGTGSLTTSALAVGTTGRTLTLLAGEAERRPDLQEFHTNLANERQQVLEDLLTAAHSESPPASGPCSSEMLRQRANSLVLRAAQACLAASKGAGFVRGHPAERAVREATFFLVWSCPQPVVAAALREFTCASGWE